MEGYCLRTHLIENPSVYFYYKGMEDNSTSPDAKLPPLVKNL